MNDDELTKRLRRSAPVVDGSVHPTSGPQAHQLMEQIMTTPITDTTNTPPARPARRRWLPAVAGSAALVAAVAVGITVLGGDVDGKTASTTVTYSLTPTDPLMSTCITMDEYQPPAGMAGFKGTVVELSDTSVTLEVERWYAGGDAGRVVLSITDVSIPALDGVEFVQGGSYLVGVADGQVQTCGVTAPFDPALERIYEGWFAG